MSNGKYKKSNFLMKPKKHMMRLKLIIWKRLLIIKIAHKFKCKMYYQQKVEIKIIYFIFKFILLKYKL